LRSVQTLHSQRNLGLLIDDGEKKIYYSGDGRPTEEVADLVRDSDLAVHEAFRLDEEIHHHGSMTGCLKLAYTNNIKRMALVHLERNFRLQQINEINELVKENPVLVLPVSGDRIQL
jgi:ribonuclease Z